jgi:hypothetical protein
MDNKKVPKSSGIFCCNTCDYNTSRKSQYDRHLSTDKHKKREMDNKDNEMDNEKVPNFFLCICGKKYNYLSGLCKHKSKCLYTETDKNNPEDNLDSDVIVQLIKQNENFKNLLIDQNKTIIEQNNKILNIYKNTTNTTLINNNSNNKTFNLNIFLNEECKDAMNIMDFVDSLKLQLSDLENIGKIGFIEGISNIIIKNLKALDIHKRPVHCSDSKREVMYVKDDDKWEKENEEKKKLRKAIKYIAHKNSKLIPEFKEKYPDCGRSDSKKSDQYNKLIIEAMGGQGDNELEKEDKIIKKIAKEVIIDKNNEI